MISDSVSLWSRLVRHLAQGCLLVHCVGMGPSTFRLRVQPHRHDTDPFIIQRRQRAFRPPQLGITSSVTWMLFGCLALHHFSLVVGLPALHQFSLVVWHPALHHLNATFVLPPRKHISHSKGNQFVISIPDVPSLLIKTVHLSSPQHYSLVMVTV